MEMDLGFLICLHKIFYRLTKRSCTGACLLLILPPVFPGSSHVQKLFPSYTQRLWKEVLYQKAIELTQESVPRADRYPANQLSNRRELAKITCIPGTGIYDWKYLSAITHIFLPAIRILCHPIRPDDGHNHRQPRSSMNRNGESGKCSHTFPILRFLLQRDTFMWRWWWAWRRRLKNSKKNSEQT